MTLAHFHWVDWAIVTIVGLSVALSLWRGFAREAMSLAGWVAAFVLANLFADSLALLLGNVIENATGRIVAAYVLLFIAALMTANFISMLVAQIIRFTGLSPLDRLLGTIFGFTRGIIVILVFVFVARELLPTENQQWVLESQLMPHLDMLTQWVESVFWSLGDGRLPKISI